MEMASRSSGAWSTLQGRVIQAEALAQELLQLAACLVTVARAPDQDMGGQGGKPLVISQTCTHGPTRRLAGYRGE